MIQPQAAPKTHPGGVHGALFNDWYHSENAPSPERRVPKPNAPKFKTIKIVKYLKNDFLFIVLILIQA